MDISMKKLQRYIIGGSLFLASFLLMYQTVPVAFCRAMFPYIMRVIHAVLNYKIHKKAPHQ